MADDEKQKKKKMTREEAGRKGGEKISGARGKEFDQQIGKKGGAATKPEMGSRGYSEPGRKGAGERARGTREEGLSPETGVIRDPETVARHIRDDISFPVGKEDIVKACDEMSDLDERDREFIAKYLPDKTYNDADEVIRTLGLTEQGEGEEEQGQQLAE